MPRETIVAIFFGLTCLVCLVLVVRWLLWSKNESLEPLVPDDPQNFAPRTTTESHIAMAQAAADLARSSSVSIEEAAAALRTVSSTMIRPEVPRLTIDYPSQPSVEQGVVDRMVERAAEDIDRRIMEQFEQSLGSAPSRILWLNDLARGEVREVRAKLPDGRTKIITEFADGSACYRCLKKGYALARVKVRDDDQYEAYEALCLDCASHCAIEEKVAEPPKIRVIRMG